MMILKFSRFGKTFQNISKKTCWIFLLFIYYLVLRGQPFKEFSQVRCQVKIPLELTSCSTEIEKKGTTIKTKKNLISMENISNQNMVGLSNKNIQGLFKKNFCQTPVLGLGLGVDFTFAGDNHKSQKKWQPSQNFCGGNSTRGWGTKVWDKG